METSKKEIRKAEKSAIRQASAKLADIIREHQASQEKGSGVTSPLVGMAERIAARAARGNGLGEEQA